MRKEIPPCGIFYINIFQPFNLLLMKSLVKFLFALLALLCLVNFVNVSDITSLLLTVYLLFVSCLGFIYTSKSGV